MLNGLDLFSGIGGISIALREWVRPVAYCEIDPYCQAVLLGHMANQRIPIAPIWDDITTFSGADFRGAVEIIYGGFPCQDISVAGLGKGLEGKRSGLFFEMLRLAKEIKPQFLFLENVPAITSRGGVRVVREITEMGYDCRWCVISAASVGAPHLRERWFLLAHAKHFGSYGSEIRRGTETSISDAPQGKNVPKQPEGVDFAKSLAAEFAPNSSIMRRDEGAGKGIHSERQTIVDAQSCDIGSPIFVDWKNTEPPICGMAHGLPHRVDRIRGLGNAVVPIQAKKAFKILMGIK